MNFSVRNIIVVLIIFIIFLTFTGAFFIVNETKNMVPIPIKLEIFDMK